MRLGQFVRSGVAHPLREDASADVPIGPIGAVASEADDVRPDEADADTAAAGHDLLDEHAG